MRGGRQGERASPQQLGEFGKRQGTIVEIGPQRENYPHPTRSCRCVQHLYKGLVMSILDDSEELFELVDENQSLGPIRQVFERLSDEISKGFLGLSCHALGNLVRV